MPVQRWKVLGLAGIAGVATTAVVLAARHRRSWTEHDPDDLRARLHARFAEAHGPGPAARVEV